jgi:alkylation response protein AidB-like acyl-CoA dehydrogenase
MDADVLTLVDAIADFFERRGDASVIAEASLTSRAADRQRWTALCAMGLPVLRVPEPDGIGAGLLEATGVAEKLGAVLLPEPAVPTIVLAPVWRAGASRLLDALCDGSRVTALSGLDTVELSAAGTVSGRIRVPDDDMTDAVALLTRDSGAGGWAIVVVDSADMPPPVSRTTVDPTRPTATIDLDGVEPVEVSGLSGAEAQRIRRELVLLTTAELVGNMQHVLTVTLAHTKSREQFGRPIGSYQAVKHRLADMYIATEQARAAVQLAAIDCTDDVESASESVASAARWVPRSAIEVCESAVHLHGAMGYCWETGLHLHLRRALATAHALDGSKAGAVKALSSEAR